MLKKIMIILLSLLSTAFILIFISGLARTYQVQHSANQKKFLAGTVPQEMPDGLYRGSIGSTKVSWQGKEFSARSKSGINLFKTGQNRTKNYPFKIYTGKGLQDKNLDVIKIDYSENKKPWWLGYILDEVVETSPGHLLGKVHITFVPGIPFTLGYFTLVK